MRRTEVEVNGSHISGGSTAFGTCVHELCRVVPFCFAIPNKSGAGECSIEDFEIRRNLLCDTIMWSVLEEINNDDFSDQGFLWFTFEQVSTVQDCIAACCAQAGCTGLQFSSVYNRSCALYLGDTCTEDKDLQYDQNWDMEFRIAGTSADLVALPSRVFLVTARWL